MSDRTGQPARYQRTFGGLIGSMLVLLLAVGAFVVFRSAVRSNPDEKPTAVDWRAAVRGIEQGGDTVVHPTRVPADWTVTSANYQPGSSPKDRRWDMGAIAPHQRFVGLAQSGTSLADLVSTYVNANAEPGPSVWLTGPFAGSWQTWTDSGGDYAVGRELTGALTGQYLVVFGTAADAELRAYAETLTAAPLTAQSTSASASSASS